MVDRLLWVNVETSGFTQNAPLEIACFTTDPDGDNLEQQYQSLVLPHEFFEGELDIDPEVWHKHYASGLIMEFEGLQELSTTIEDKVNTLNKYAVAVIDFTMAKLLHGQEYMLAGDNAWYAREVLVRTFPKSFATVKTDSVMDTAGLTALLEFKGYTLPAQQNRAMADLERSLRCYRMVAAGLDADPLAVIDAGS